MPIMGSNIYNIMQNHPMQRITSLHGGGESNLSVFLKIFQEYHHLVSYILDTARVVWLSGRFEIEVCWFETHWRYCVVSMSKTLYLQLSTRSTQEDRKLSCHE